MTRAKRPFGVPIAKRELGVEGSKKMVTVELGRPRPADADYGCAYRIKYGTTTVHREIFGVDAFQAMELALRMVGVELHHHPGLPTGRMYWLKRNNDVGFPDWEIKK